jgi:type I site-specific restriction endonuclease
VKVLAKRVQYYDADGKLVTESFQDYTRKTLLKDKDYASLDDFIRKWHSADRKQVIIKSWSNSVFFGTCWPKRWGKISTRSICCAT